MVLKSPNVLAALAKFLSCEISERGIDYLTPLESKGALLMDLALQYLPDDEVRPNVLYLRSLEYLAPEIRRTARFGILDDFVFSGRTIGRAVRVMQELDIPRDHIHSLAFFMFGSRGNNDDGSSKIISGTGVPEIGSLLRLSQDEILRDVQMLAIEHKIPASYDNLNWDVHIGASEYARFMKE